MSTIRQAESDKDIRRCFPVMHELRTHLDESTFVEQVKRQMATQGYKLAYVEREDNVERAGDVKCEGDADGDGAVVSVAGYRIVEMLAWGKTLYVDDLVTADAHRSGGHGGKLFDWLVEQARRHVCDQFHLDSGVQRFAAHRFYLRKRMDITSHHFAMNLRDQS